LTGLASAAFTHLKRTVTTAINNVATAAAPNTKKTLTFAKKQTILRFLQLLVIATA
jgi:hypothetical protein